MLPKFCGLYFHVASNCSWKVSSGEGALTWGSRGRSALPRVLYPPQHHREKSASAWPPALTPNRSDSEIPFTVPRRPGTAGLNSKKPPGPSPNTELGKFGKTPNLLDGRCLLLACGRWPLGHHAALGLASAWGRSFTRCGTDFPQQGRYHSQELSHIFQNNPFSFRA